MSQTEVRVREAGRHAESFSELEGRPADLTRLQQRHAKRMNSLGCYCCSVLGAWHGHLYRQKYPAEFSGGALAAHYQTRPDSTAESCSSHGSHGAGMGQLSKNKIIGTYNPKKG
jgi:hypothetical protein